MDKKAFLVHKKKVAFSKTTAKEIIAARELISSTGKAMDNLHKAFNNPKSKFEASKLKKVIASLDKQMNWFNNQLPALENTYKAAISFGVPTTAIEQTILRTANLISKMALLKSCAEASFVAEDMVEIDENGYVIDSALEAQGKCKKAEDEEAEAEAPKAEETQVEEAPAEETQTEEAPAEAQAEAEEAQAETQAEETEAPAEEAKEEESEAQAEEIQDENLEAFTEEVQAEIFDLGERLENVEEQLGIDPEITASVKTANTKQASIKSQKVQKMRLASARNEESQVQDVLDSIIAMEIH